MSGPSSAQPRLPMHDVGAVVGAQRELDLGRVRREVADRPLDLMFGYFSWNSSAELLQDVQAGAALRGPHAERGVGERRDVGVDRCRVGAFELLVAWRRTAAARASRARRAMTPGSLRI